MTQAEVTLRARKTFFLPNFELLVAVLNVATVFVQVESRLHRAFYGYGNSLLRRQPIHTLNRYFDVIVRSAGEGVFTSGPMAVVPSPKSQW